ncbi:MobV family relaxase [Marinococcus sp. PL1-022]|uniref:MobV family relaxase n=1 Tax=Marinococcus sp. PL1-022 TaxID=3095363 RepID=UPI0029C198FD|nr:MobV family relaxase [Marinococcus sp. PL1-022]MDX6154483.1 MobV family relaxase [Marinococcus sp. PL1-022]
MSYVVLRMQKFKQKDLKGIQIHNQRERESQTNMDIDEVRSSENYDLLHDGPIDYNKQVEARIEEGRTVKTKVRKDAVRIASFLVSSDEEFFNGLTLEEEKQFFEDSLTFFQERYGKENIAYAMVHKDEKTPHMHVGLVPLTDDGRLAAKDFFGKPKQLVELQDDYAGFVKAQGFDLERGVSSDKKHIEERRFKALTAEKRAASADSKFESTLKKQDRAQKQLNQTEKQLEKMNGQLNAAVEKMNEAKFQTGNLEKLKEQVQEAEEELQQKQAMIRKADEQNGKLENIEEIVERAEPKKKFFKDTVEMPLEDFERFKQAAHHGVQMQQQVEPYRKENAQLKTELQKQKEISKRLHGEREEERTKKEEWKAKYEGMMRSAKEHMKEAGLQWENYEYVREFLGKMYGKMKSWVQEKDQAGGQVTKEWEERLPKMKREAHKETKEDTGYRVPDVMKEETTSLGVQKRKHRDRGMEI